LAREEPVASAATANAYSRPQAAFATDRFWVGHLRVVAANTLGARINSVLIT